MPSDRIEPLFDSDDDDTQRACSCKFAPAFPLTDDDIANIKAEFMAGDPKVTFVIHDEKTDHE